MAKILFKKGHEPIPGCFSKGSKHSEESKQKMREAQIERMKKGLISPHFTTKGLSPWNKGKKYSLHTEESREKISEATKGERHWNWKRGELGLPLCKCGKRLSTRKNETCVKCMHENRVGSNHPNWKNGVSKNVHSTKEPKYRKWRMGVFTRDEFTCRVADNKCNGQLQAHHISRWADYPKLRYVTNNGITLCLAHHPRKKSEEKRLAPLFRGLVSVSSDHY